MYVVTSILGNLHETEALALEVQRLEKQDKVERVHIPFHDAGRRRLRVTTDGGLNVGVDLADGTALRDGDVLTGEQDSDKLIVIEVAPSEAMALSISADIPSDELFELGVKLGHMLGNQHWPITVKNDVVYAPLSIDHKVMETVVRTHGFEGIEFKFVPVQPGEVPTAMPKIEHHHH